MRISTSMIYESGTAGMLDQQSALYKTQQQMSSNRRILTAADDPAGASAALRVSQGLALTAQQQANQQAATSTLQQSESTLGSVGDLLQSATTLLMSTQNATFGAGERNAVASQLEGMLHQLIGLANSRDGAGGYLFAGYSETAQPFAAGAGGVAYSGDDGVRQLDVAAGRQLAVSVSGSDAFMRIKTGNGVFTSTANGANTGTGIIDSGSVANPAALDGHAYRLAFTVSAGVTTYDVLDVTAGSTVSTGNAFTSGNAITVAGMQLNVTGAPANGDRFDARPSANQSVFQSLADGIAALRSTASTGTRYSQVNTAVANLYQAQDAIGLARSSLGSNLSELAVLGSAASAANVSQQTRLSGIVDLDYTAAATQLASQQVSLQAAQQTFSKVSQLSLFNFLA